MAVLRQSKTILAAKKESSYGSAATLAGTDCFLVTDVSLTPLATDVVERPTINGFPGAKPFIQANTHVELSATMELTPSGTAGTPPDYLDLLLGAGLVHDNQSSFNKFTPETDLSTADSLTIGVYIDGSLHKMTGARGSISLAVSTAEAPQITFTYQGVYVAPSATTNLTPTYAQLAPLVANATNTTGFQIHSYAGALQSFTFDQNNNLYYSELVSSTKQVRITERASSGAVTIESVGLGTKNFYNIANSTATGNLTWQHGQTAGNKITFLASTTQLENISQESNEDYQMLNIGYRALPNAGNDEFELKFH
ncbi:MAG: hypothetical protein CMC15_17905 [Flavobacteriaceae bacterium]|nr:hypothetical protein [Flavobacteriaceae bacterium]|tara:strand:+ start:1553 stop:2485 length:933 start_codon:yes stop_codon:yes gene_type:complete